MGVKKLGYSRGLGLDNPGRQDGWVERSGGSKFTMRVC